MLGISDIHAVSVPELSSADSLFAEKKYTEAYQLYDNIFSKGYSSPSMLVKMAFIKEGLGDYTQALYFLNLYYDQTSNRKVLLKMREIAEKHNLVGYEYSDTKFITNFFYKNRHLLLMALMSISLFIIVYSFKKRRTVSFMPFIGQGIILGLIFILINGFFFKQYAIVTGSNTIAMQAPSAGSEPVELIEKGNKIILLENRPIWSKIRWNEEEVYIKSNLIKKI